MGIRLKYSIAWIVIILLASCSVQKHVERSTTTTETTTERSIDTTVIVSPPIITVFTPKDSLIRAIMRDSVYQFTQAGNMVEIDTKHGITKITVKPKPIAVKVKMHEKIASKQEVKTKTKDVERTSGYKWYIFIGILLLSIIFYRMFVSPK